jgi:hypothetical protein
LFEIKEPKKANGRKILRLYYRMADLGLEPGKWYKIFRLSDQKERPSFVAKFEQITYLGGLGATVSFREYLKIGEDGHSLVPVPIPPSIPLGRISNYRFEKIDIPEGQQAPTFVGGRRRKSRRRASKKRRSTRRRV